jgi:hypothetical protein
VVSGNQERRGASVLLHSLHRVPELFDEAVDVERGSEEQVVARFVRTLVVLAVPNEENARAVPADLV